MNETCWRASNLTVRPPQRDRRYLVRLVMRRLAFLIALTSWVLLMVDRPEMSSRRATSIKCLLDALASTPSAEVPEGFGPPLRARVSDGPFSAFGSQWSPTFS